MTESQYQALIVFATLFPIFTLLAYLWAVAFLRRRAAIHQQQRLMDWLVNSKVITRDR